MTPSPARRLAVESNAIDADLMARVRQRDPRAVHALFDRHASLVHGLGLRILRDPGDAEDLVHDVFLHLWRRAELFDGERGQFVGWLVSLTRNRAIDRLRAKRVRRREGDQDEAGFAFATAPRRVDPNESPYAAELRTVVGNALADLPASHREAVELAYFGGLSHSEIADRLAAPLGEVKARIRQGMLELRDLLGDFADAGLAMGAEE